MKRQRFYHALLQAYAKGRLSIASDRYETMVIMTNRTAYHKYFVLTEHPNNDEFILKVLDSKAIDLDGDYREAFKAAMAELNRR